MDRLYALEELSKDEALRELLSPFLIMQADNLNVLRY